ncbi:MAG: 50S ribosomal protein L11 methyltransferase, partial [Pyrinomonadaceae bacterium]
THETTRLCLRTIEEIYAGESFFDVGTGTGILAIAAAKLQDENQLSKSKIVGCDTDEDSITIAKENVEINQTEEIELYVGSISEDTRKFDFVCANLTADVIVPLLPLLVEKAEKKLLLSGILKEQEDWAASALRELRITNYELRTDGEWISILVVSGEW